MIVLSSIKGYISLDMMLTTWAQIEEGQKDVWDKILSLYNNYEIGIVSTFLFCSLLLNRIKIKLTILSQNFVSLTL